MNIVFQNTVVLFPLTNKDNEFNVASTAFKNQFKTTVALIVHHVCPFCPHNQPPTHTLFLPSV